MILLKLVNYGDLPFKYFPMKKLRPLVKTLKKSPYLDKNSRKEALKGFLSRVPIRLAYIFGEIDYINSKLASILEEFDKQQEFFLKKQILFYLEKILDNFPGGYKNYSLLEEEFIGKIADYMQNPKSLIATYELLKLVHRTGIFKKYNKKEYFEKFMEKISYYIGTLIWGKGVSGSVKINRMFFEEVNELDELINDLENFDIYFLLEEVIKKDLDLINEKGN